MKKMAMDTFSTFLLYLVDILLGMVCVRERGQSQCRHGDGGGRVSFPRYFESTLTITTTFKMQKKQLCFCGGGQSANNDPRKYLNHLKIHSIEYNIPVLLMNMN